MKAQIQRKEPNSIASWIIKKEDGNLYAANIYNNYLHKASELTEADINKLKNETQNSNYQILIHKEI